MIAIDVDDLTPPSEQVRRQIATAIRGGALRGGSRLPAIRQLAADLRVSAGTVARAYQQLETDGLIQTSRARGTTVAPDRAIPPAVVSRVEELLAAVRDEPIVLEDLLAAVAVMWPVGRPTTTG